MKNNMVKKLLTLALAGAMTLSLAACGSKSDDSSNDAQQGGDESGKTYKVAIIKQLDHASLDEIANAVAAELAIYEDLAKAGIPHYTGADSFVRNGAYATCGVNYTDLGAKTADLAYSAITDGMDAMEDYYLMDGGIITVNTDTAAAMSLDYSCFDSMGTVVEVTTTKD